MSCDMTAQRLHLQKDYTNQETVSGSALKIQIKLTFISESHIIFNVSARWKFMEQQQVVHNFQSLLIKLYIY